MQTTLLLALGLMLIMEGLLPLIAPSAWRETFVKLITLSDGQLRFIGLMSLIAGLMLVYFYKH